MGLVCKDDGWRLPDEPWVGMSFLSAFKSISF